MTEVHAALGEREREFLRSDARVSAFLPFVFLCTRATADAMREQHRASGVHERLSRAPKRLANRFDGAEIGRYGPREVAAECDVVLEREVNHTVGVSRRRSQPVEIVEAAAQHLGPRR